ncbi:hypothetical protein [Lapillicoccus jejuensis]|uniref:hypothetical protein n=1 Tax=Lapillicoccus jejuensis TaxID=402171 RepID=UPI001477036C|nr:hypothetical protein [Lapillicoccus jejuensis]
MALYFARVNEAWTRPQAGLITPLCATSSKSCASVEQVARDLLSKGQKYDGPPVRLGSATVLGRFDPSSTEVVSQALQERRNIVDAAGSVVSTDSQKPVSNVFTISWQESGWQIQKIEDVQ